jgi:methoxymalonate biosynthesis protein
MKVEKVPVDKAKLLITDIVGNRAAEWDRRGRISREAIEEASATGLLCAGVPAEYGGLDLPWADNGELTAHFGTLCGSLRSLATSQGIATWTIYQLGNSAQRHEFLRNLTDGRTASVAFSEPHAGSDLSAMRTEIELDGDTVVVNGRKVWVTGAVYADVVVVFGRFRNGGAAVVVPASAKGVTIIPVPDPLGCRAAGHSDVVLDNVRLPARHLLERAGQDIGFLVTPALTYGRLSVAWGCVGILRACLSAASLHSRTREQFGKPLSEHQLIKRHLAMLLVAEQTATRVSEHAAHCWDTRSAEMVRAALVAKHVAAGNAARGAATAVQVLASAGARDGHVVARAYRDAKLMEIIEGTDEVIELLLADEALVARS